MYSEDKKKVYDHQYIVEKRAYCHWASQEQFQFSKKKKKEFEYPLHVLGNDAKVVYG